MTRSNQLIIGCASTGAKFTPLNHRSTDNLHFDNICWGTDIPITRDEIQLELDLIYALGCRYYHYHARNPVTREQTTDNVVYQGISQLIQSRCPDTLISFGTSRNGKEVRDAINKFGEWERVSQCALPIHLGGAHLVTIQAAIELQIICQIERNTKHLCQKDIESIKFLETISSYNPSYKREKFAIETNSTSKGSNYGSSSPKVQFDTYRSAIN